MYLAPGVKIVLFNSSFMWLNPMLGFARCQDSWSNYLPPSGVLDLGHILGSLIYHNASIWHVLFPVFVNFVMIFEENSLSAFYPIYGSL